MVGNFTRDYQRLGMDKIIHQLWGGTSPMTSNYLQCMNTVIDKNPGWKHRLWDDKAAYEQTADVICELKIPFHDYKYDICRWDILRVLILYKFGGICCDLDMECIESLENFPLTNHCGFLFEPKVSRSSNSFVHQSFIYSDPGDEFLRFILKRSRIKYNNIDEVTSPGDYISQTIGPDMLTSIYHSYRYKDNIQLIPPNLIERYIHHHNFAGWKENP